MAEPVSLVKLTGPSLGTSWSTDMPERVPTLGIGPTILMNTCKQPAGGVAGERTVLGWNGPLLAVPDELEGTAPQGTKKLTLYMSPATLNERLGGVAFKPFISWGVTVQGPLLTRKR